MAACEHLIIVSGASSAAGKTALAEALIASLRCRPPAAVKITVTHDIVAGCPRGGSGCGVCASVPTGYRVITDPEVIAQPATDTGRYALAGADPVLWIITQPTDLARAWHQVTRRIEPRRTVVVESNSLAILQAPALSFFTVNPRIARARWKASAVQLGRQSDFLIVSQQGCRDDRAEKLFHEFAMIRDPLTTLLLPSVEDAVLVPEVERRIQPFLKAS